MDLRISNSNSRFIALPVTRLAGLLTCRGVTMQNNESTITEQTYNRSNDYYNKPEGLVLCACMGPAPGEPHCPCSMAYSGLPMSIENVEAIRLAQLEWGKFFDEGGFSNDI
jgi:hypothetical protein